MDLCWKWESMKNTGQIFVGKDYILGIKSIRILPGGVNYIEPPNRQEGSY